MKCYTLLTRTFLFAYSYVSNMFCTNLKVFVASRQRKGKRDKAIRYAAYCIWAQAMKKKNIGPKDAIYTFPAEVLTFIRSLAPQDITGDIRENAHLVTMQQFGEAVINA